MEYTSIYLVLSSFWHPTCFKSCHLRLLHQGAHTICYLQLLTSSNKDTALLHYRASHSGWGLFPLLETVRTVHQVRVISQGTEWKFEGGQPRQSAQCPLESRSSASIPCPQAVELTTSPQIHSKGRPGFEGGTSSSLKPRIATKVENHYVLQKIAPTANEGQGLEPLLPTF